MLTENQKEIITNSACSKIHAKWISEQTRLKGVEMVKLPIFQIIAVSISVFTGVLVGMIFSSSFLEISTTMLLILAYKSYQTDIGYFLGASPPYWVKINNEYKGQIKYETPRYIYNFNDKNESQRLLSNLVKYNNNHKTWETDAMVPWRTYPGEYNFIIEQPRIATITYIINAFLLIMIIPCYYGWFYRIMASLTIYAVHYLYKDSRHYIREHNSSATLHHECRQDKLIIVKKCLDDIINKYIEGSGQFELLNDMELKNNIYKSMLKDSKFFKFVTKENYKLLPCKEQDRIDMIYEIIVKELFNVMRK